MRLARAVSRAWPSVRFVLIAALLVRAQPAAGQAPPPPPDAHSGMFGAPAPIGSAPRGFAATAPPRVGLSLARARF